MYVCMYRRYKKNVKGKDEECGGGRGPGVPKDRTGKRYISVARDEVKAKKREEESNEYQRGEQNQTEKW
ncbi:hypothetical protein WN55_09330 [Dufourea novaeangliae]|uniref:Uncharacterized protein n=1 Tax=Dufourea novaeangliae TaxID=178035 RepID=A0A154P913_DUFNO|nr:hypothetical protein WN55_09330 [Dufourea novaeangliae]